MNDTPKPGTILSERFVKDKSGQGGRTVVTYYGGQPTRIMGHFRP
jgi:hypothetical protein